jgi:cytochrome P450
MRFTVCTCHLAFVKKTYKEMVIGGITYPAGVIILNCPIMFIHHDPDIWGSDAHEFRSNRFQEVFSKHPMIWVPSSLSDGDRASGTGQNFALLEANMLICIILQNS